MSVSQSEVQVAHSTDDSSKADGTIVIFDIETNGVARKLRGHTRQIQSLRYDKLWWIAMSISPCAVGLVMVDISLVPHRTGSVSSGISMTAHDSG